MRSVVKLVIAVAVILSIHFGTNLTEWAWKEKPDELFGGNFNVCMGPSEDGSACEQVFYVKKSKDGQVTADLEMHLAVGTEKTPAFIGLVTPSKLKIVGRRFCVLALDMIYSDQTTLFDIIDGKPQNMRNPTIEEATKMRNSLRQGNKGAAPEYACMTLHKRIGTEKYVLKTYGNEYFGFAQHVGPARAVDSNTKLLIKPIPFGRPVPEKAA